MTNSVLYCGDTSLASAAAYLAGLMTSWGIDLEYVPSDRPLSAGQLEGRRLLILSDYPAARIAADLQQRVAEQVAAGMGLLMIGGWESFHGVGGDWDGSLVESLLPVEVSEMDDRINCDQPALLRKTVEHPIVNDLPWDSRPPGIGGFNRFHPRADAEVLLEVDRWSVCRSGNDWTTAVESTHPVLVVGRYGEGRTAALATDVAPHWVGGLVDWGTGRVTAQAAGADAVEVGDRYAQFFHQLIDWCGSVT